MSWSRLLLAFAVVAVVPAIARAGDDFKPYRGKILITPDPIPKEGAALARYLKGKVKDRYRLPGELGGETWKCEMLGVLAGAASDDAVALALYDDPGKDASKRGEPVQRIDVGTPGPGNVVLLRDITLTKDAGFAGGKTYLVLFLRDEAVLATARVTLEPHD